MPRKRTIVGIGEAVLVEHADCDEPAGIACAIAINAAMLGHTGLAISRIGQDAAGATLLERLRAVDVETGHLQSDPDLPTPRHRLSHRDRFDAQMSFDNLQWDFDLSDVAQQADAVIFGALARRSGQARSTIDRFVAECAMALKVFDLSGCPPEELERSTALAALRLVDAAVVDPGTTRSLIPGASNETPREAILQLIRETNLSFVLQIAPDARPIVHTSLAAHEGRETHDSGLHEATVVALVHGSLCGWNLDKALRLAEAFARHRREYPLKPAPSSMMETTGG